VTLSALRIAGGLVVASRAWALLVAPQDHEDRKQAQAAPAAGAQTTSPSSRSPWPFTAGPGTIAVAIALGASGPPHALDSLPHFAGGSLAAVAVAVTVGCYAEADRVVALLGPAGARVVTRLTAFLLLCIGVQIVLTGVQDALAPLLAWLLGATGAVAAPWVPRADEPFDMQLTAPFQLVRKVGVLALGAFDSSPGRLQDLKAHGVRLACVINAGAWEKWRPDSGCLRPAAGRDQLCGVARLA
jgi:small neutral amino acid transporter SnatA (MarC family)